MKEFIEYVTRQLVDNPSQVHIDEVVGEHTVIYKLQVNTEDMGMVIGKKGRTADSLRTIVAAAAAKQGKRSVVEIVETNRIRKNVPKKIDRKAMGGQPVFLISKQLKTIAK